MKDGHCPVCHSTEVYTSDEATPRAHGYYLYLDAELSKESQELTFSGYVCANCGYTVFFVDEPEKLPLLKKAKDWHKVAAV